ncbi:geminin-like protein [Saccoglossus kowalevskii]|uniref:Geminin-like protein n=1 Tax=Saccoglossus kowalevskii TaxID=10224 RepID=D1LX27_SACKO|nr:geminin-like protein [Saccoglossus kowalevskii]ACY92533.1 geminin-like protein [Saccoglossus kowalevskii]
MATPLSNVLVNAQKNAVFRRLEVRRQGGCNSDTDGSSGLSDLEVPNKMISMSTMGGKNRMFTPARKRSSKKLGQSSPGLSDKRMTLKTLQPLAGSQSTLVGTNGFIRLCDSSMKKGKRKQTESEDQQYKQGRSKLMKSSKVLGAAMIYKDPETDAPTEKKGKSLAEEAIEMMTSESVPESYWKELAEERRKALEEALKENEQLHGKVQELKTEVMKLSELAGQTEYFASIIKELMDERKKDDESSDENEASSEENEASSEENEETNKKLADNAHSFDSDTVIQELDEKEKEDSVNINTDELSESSEEETIKLIPLQQPQFSDSEQNNSEQENDADSS